jgi:hypothetical protein
MGHRPSIAIFMDGVNTGPVFDASEFSKGIALRFQFNGAELRHLPEMLLQLPVIKLLSPRDRLGFLDGGPDIFPIEHTDTLNAVMVNRFVENAKLRLLLGKMYGVPVLQFLQPNTYVSYDTQLLKGGPARQLASEHGRLMARNYRAIYEGVNLSRSGFVDLSGLFEEFGLPAVVDGLHYSPSFNWFLAQRVATFFHPDTLKPYSFFSHQSTGLPFRAD